jgi:hypothetical protein
MSHEVTCNVKEVLLSKNAEGRRDAYQIRVVQWNTSAPTIEKREFFVQGTETRNGKAKGFNLEEFELMLANADKIRALLHVETKPVTP